jgi:hypothetical protein
MGYFLRLLTYGALGALAVVAALILVGLATLLIVYGLASVAP